MGNDLIAGVGGVDVLERRAHVRVAADPGHVQGHRDPHTDVHQGLECGRVERRGDVGHRHTEESVDGPEEAVEGRDGLVRLLGELGLANQPGGQERIVIVHADDRDVGPRSEAEGGEDPRQVRGDLAEGLLDAGRIDPREAAAGLDVVGADVDGDESDRPAVLEEEFDGVRQLDPQVVLGPAIARSPQHVLRGLRDCAAELLELELRLRDLQGLVELVGIPVRGRVIDARGIGLDAHRQGIPQREVPELLPAIAPGLRRGGQGDEARQGQEHGHRLPHVSGSHRISSASTSVEATRSLPGPRELARR